MKRIFVVIISVSFVLNLVWENLQAPLYQNYQGFWNHFPFCLVGAFGDVGAIMLGYILVILIRKRIDWYNDLKIASLVLFFFFELALGYLVEWYALSHNLWTYTSSMPTLSSLSIGVLPLVQLGITGMLAIFVTARSKTS